MGALLGIRLISRLSPSPRRGRWVPRYRAGGTDCSMLYVTVGTPPSPHAALRALYFASSRQPRSRRLGVNVGTSR